MVKDKQPCRICKGQQKTRCMFCGWQKKVTVADKRKQHEASNRKIEHLDYLGSVYNQLLRLGMENTGLVGRYQGRLVGICRKNDLVGQLVIWDGFEKKVVPDLEVTDIDLNELDKAVRREIGDPTKPGAQPYGAGAQQLRCEVVNKSVHVRKRQPDGEETTIRIRVRSLKVFDGQRLIARASVRGNQFNVYELREVLPVLNSLMYRAYERAVTRKVWFKQLDKADVGPFCQWLESFAGKDVARDAFSKLMGD